MMLFVILLAFVQVFMIDQLGFLGAGPMLWLLYVCTLGTDRNWLSVAADAALFLVITTMFRVDDGVLVSVCLLAAMLVAASLGRTDHVRAHNGPSKVAYFWMRSLGAVCVYLLAVSVIGLVGNGGALNLSAVIATFVLGVGVNFGLIMATGSLVQRMQRAQ